MSFMHTHTHFNNNNNFQPHEVVNKIKYEKCLTIMNQPGAILVSEFAVPS
jgi:hypothetical protein